MRKISVILILFAVVASATAQQRAVRDIRAGLGKVVWACGDGGLILRSDDGGKTWRRLNAKTDANFQMVCLDTPSVYFIGGRGEPGFSAGAGRGVIVRTDDGKTFARMPATTTGWLYGGIISASSAVLVGQAGLASPGGVYRTTDDGQTWTSVPQKRNGYLLGSAFRGFRFGYLVGGNQRIADLKKFAESKNYSTSAKSSLALRAVAFGGKSTCWAVGDNGVVLHGRTGPDPLPVKPLPFQPGTQRLADLETVEVHKDSVYIAGGLTGQLFISRTAGRKFARQAAPGPGPVHILRRIGDKLFATGDAGRIWASTDDGKTWKLTHGAEATDVLFIIGAGDISAYPAIVAHSRAGLSVAVVYATSPRQEGLFQAVPPGQQQRAAAVAAGATGTAVLNDFPSIAQNINAADWPAKKILAAWSKSLDVPADREMIRQIAAAIRLYRPAVVAVGPDNAETLGPDAENRLVSRLAQKAVKLAADPQALKELAKANLKPHRPQRIFIAAGNNEHYQPPWESPTDPARKTYTCRVDATNFPAGAATSIELLAARAVWLLGRKSLLTRPADMACYSCPSANQDQKYLMFTGGLAGYEKNYLHFQTPSIAQKMLATGASMKMADPMGRLATILPGLTRDAKAKPTDGSSINPSLLAVDRLLLVWWRLNEQGKLIQARQARDAFLRLGKSHPLHRQAGVTTLVTMCSAEYQRAWQRLGPNQSLDAKAVTRAAKKFRTLYPWPDTPAGQMLLGHGLQVTGKKSQAREVFARLSTAAVPRIWQRAARFRQDQLHGSPPETKGLTRAVTVCLNQPVKIDGHLDEPFWKRLKQYPLTGQPGVNLAGTAQFYRTVGNIVIGLRLPSSPGRTWRVAVAFDSDCDAWTQLLLEFDTTGKKRARLHCRIGPNAKLASKTFRLQSPRDETDGWHSFELALPIQHLANSWTGGLWKFQIRATTVEKADDENAITIDWDADADKTPAKNTTTDKTPDENKTTDTNKDSTTDKKTDDNTTPPAVKPLSVVRNIYFQPQPDHRMLPERYGLLQLPPPKQKKPTRRPPNRRTTPNQ
ncbi:MAG: hypothetical protein K8S55_09835 [Phycisphaerae bacterium]|nr:hypothetical protein [Phycisphaerae bacterium]